MRYSTTPASQSRPRVFSDHTDSVATPADIAELASDRARLGPFQPQNPAGAGVLLGSDYRSVRKEIRVISRSCPRLIGTRRDSLVPNRSRSA